jgi:hypothetical protein
MANSGALERAHTHQGSAIPGRVINLDQARARHGDQADHMVRMLAVGDPVCAENLTWGCRSQRKKSLVHE